MKLIITIFLLFSPLITFANSSVPANRHIAVQGTAEVLAKPDMAQVSFEVISFKDKSLDAKRDVDDRVNLLLKGLSKYGVKETDVSASSLLTHNDDDIFNVESGTAINAGYVLSQLYFSSNSDIYQELIVEKQIASQMFTYNPETKDPGFFFFAMGRDYTGGPGSRKAEQKLSSGSGNGLVLTWGGCYCWLKHEQLRAYVKPE